MIWLGWRWHLLTLYVRYHQCYKISLRQAHHYKVLVAFKKNCLFQLHANLWCIVFVQFNTVIHYIKTIYIYDIYFDREWYGCHLRIYSLFFSKIFRWYNKNWMYLDCIRIVYNLTWCLSGMYYSEVFTNNCGLVVFPNDVIKMNLIVNQYRPFNRK